MIHTVSTCLYEDQDYKVLYKAQGVHFDEMLPSGNAWEAVHRIDQDTSGLLLFARAELVELTRALFQTAGAVEKTYLAGASVKLPFREKLIEGFIGSRYRSSKKVKYFLNRKACPNSWHSLRPAALRIMEADPSLAGGIFKGFLYEVQLLTGARHQIRATFEALGAPLVGDKIYNEQADAADRMELHSYRLRFQHPQSPGKEIFVECPIQPA